MGEADPGQQHGGRHGGGDHDHAYEREESHSGLYGRVGEGQLQVVGEEQKNAEQGDSREPDGQVGSPR